MTLVVDDPDFALYSGDATELLRTFEPGTFDACVTSPPYLDARPEYPSPTLEQFEAIFADILRTTTGLLFLNVGRLWRQGRELRWWVELADVVERAGWEHWDTLIWAKPNANPIHGRLLANSHESVLIFGAPGRDEFVYPDAIRTPYADASIGRMSRAWNRSHGVKNDERGRHLQRSRPLHPEGARPRSYVLINTGREKGILHPAPMALELAEHLVLLATGDGGKILDPFLGSGTTALACRRLGRRCVGVELSPDYATEAASRLQQLSLLALDSEAP